MKTNLIYAELSDLNESEMRQIQGGAIWFFVAAAMTVYGAVLNLSYAVGYAVGTIEKELE